MPLDPLLAELEQNLADDFSMERLAEAGKLSRTQLYYEFYSVTGHTMGEYIRRRRLSMALKDNHFRILIGYDGKSFLAVEKPENRVLAARELDSVYVITGKTERTYFLVDALKRIKHVIDCNREEKIWEEYIESFRYWGKGNLEHESFKELKSRFFNLREVIYWWCHSFAETFRHKIFAELKDERLTKAMKDIDAQ